MDIDSPQVCLPSTLLIRLVRGYCCSQCWRVSHYFTTKNSLFFFFLVKSLLILFWNNLMLSPTHKTPNPLSSHPQWNFPQFHQKIYSCNLFRAFKTFEGFFFNNQSCLHSLSSLPNVTMANAPFSPIIYQHVTFK